MQRIQIPDGLDIPSAPTTECIACGRTHTGECDITHQCLKCEALLYSTTDPSGGRGHHCRSCGGGAFIGHQCLDCLQ